MTASSSADTSVGRYTFDNATREAAQQVRLLAEILDEHTADVLIQEGVTTGWRCLDLGAGAGTVTAWLAEQVSPTGRVVAIDADPRHIRSHDLVEVRAADVTTIDLGDGVYDLVHARLLFMHLPQRRQLLRRAVAALAPSGVLVISDWDCTRLDEMFCDGPPGLAEAFLAFQQALVGIATANGADAGWARELPLAMRRAGLTDVRARLHTETWDGGTAGCLLHASNSRQMQDALYRAGVTRAQLDILREGMSDPHTLAWSYPMVTAVGRRADN
ncbi:ubiquinone/menaquinone biosynthesis C-methylase UbiE [Micromonospora sp. Llam0]|uniref:class I SAM-dependent methyltransferase n=1 Tax=Micromonospora sp. Llam0 TaxID=2485143 RepID=UPI000F9A7CAE|nr:class I SAM-dependent methyltransferase [Micromonospora sp. Llam0]ROO63053.1 ubiquinone/menaquinone biosynthesis C-methylase UbiE [Micromonospora sp. Llam0]